MQVGLGGAHGDLRVTDAAERRVHGRPARRDVRHVRDEHGVRAQALRLALQDVEEDLAAELFFAFDEEAEVDGRAPALGHRFEEAEDLPLVVGGAARVEAPVAERRLERRRRPFVQRVGRLDVVVTVEEQRRGTGHFRPPAPDDGMRIAAEESDVVAAEPAQLFRDPLRRAPAVRIVRGESRDGRDAEKRRELGGRALAQFGATGFALALEGAALMELERIPDALASLERAAEADPDLALVWHELGVAAWKLGDGNRALLALDRAFALEPHTETLRLRGRILRPAGRHPAAEVAYEGAAQAAEHAEQRQGAEREIAITRRYAFYAPRRPEDLSPAERWFAETGTVVLASDPGPDVPDDAALVAAFLDLARDSRWRFGQVVMLGPALPAWRALADGLRLPRRRP